MKSLPNLLIVDDLEANLYLIKEIVKKLEINLIMAQSGPEALRLSKGLPIALAIIDVRMPVMDGFELAIKINEERPDDKVAVIFLTAMNSEDDDEIFQGYDSGAIDYITKPFNIHILLSKIKAFLESYEHKQLIVNNAAQLKESADNLSKANSALKKSEEKYRSYINNSPHGIFIADQEGRYIEVNEAACNITGFSAEELLKISIPEILTDESLNEGLLHFRKLAETGISKCDLQFRHKNGSKRWWTVSAVKLTDNLYLGFTEDITDRKEMEEKLRLIQVELEGQNLQLSLIAEEARNATKKYTELYDFAPVGHLNLSPEQTILELNFSAGVLLGEERSSLIGKNFNSFISKDSRPSFYSFFYKIFEQKIKASVELSLETSTNELKYVYVEGTFVEHSRQCALNVIDMTQRRLAENIIKISEEKYRMMVNNSPDGIILINMKGFIIEVSEIGQELLGAETQKDIVGKHFHRFIPSVEKNTLREIFEKTLNDGICQNVQITLKKINKPSFLSETSTTLIQANNGQPLAFMVIIRDISFRKKMEIMQIHADRMANLGEMASGMAHEINQPLNVISAVMDGILFESTISEKIDIELFITKAEKVFSNIIRIRNIIDHVRAFSRSQNDFISTAFDINASIENAVSMIEEQFKHQGISLTVKLDKQISMFIGNTYQFEQVIINLLMNAKDAVLEMKIKGEEKVELKIGVTTHHENDGVIIEVTDNGTGISNEDIQNIMLPFYTTKSEGKGTGLGLSICYQIIKNMGGSIEVLNNESGGTTVRIVLDRNL